MRGGKRTELFQRAPRNIRGHLRRAGVRIAVLLVADLAAFATMRALVRAVRDEGALGDALAEPVGQLLPSGILNGWQFAAALLIGLLVTGNYSAGDNRRSPSRLLMGCALATALPLWMTIWTRGVEWVAVHYVLTVALVWTGLLLARYVVDRVVNAVGRPARQAAATILVGRADECKAAAASPAFAPDTEYHTIGFVDVHRPVAPGALGHIDDLSVLLAASGAEIVVLCGHPREDDLTDVVDIALAGGCQVLAMPPELKLPGVEPAVVWRRGEAVLRLTAPALQGQHLLLKRIVDVVGASVGLLVAAPVMIVVAIVVKLDSRGPAFFQQERVGLGGRRFRMLKFRTMANDADAGKGAVAHLNHSGDPRLFKIPNDPRVTAAGRWIRRWSLDELPQLFNVLRGDMSLVGPRPFFETDLALYEAHHFGRLGAKPGITGLWQVSGRSDIINFEEVVALDTEYIREWSLLLDFAIMLRTLPAVVRRTGAV